MTVKLKSTRCISGIYKTKTLKPGESQTVTIKMPVGVLASYDYNDANYNGFKGYEIERGDYTLFVVKNLMTHGLMEIAKYIILLLILF